MCFIIFSFTGTILFAHCTTSGENTRGIQESNDNAPVTVCRGTNGFGLQVRTARCASPLLLCVVSSVQKIETPCGPNWALWDCAQCVSEARRYGSRSDHDGPLITSVDPVRERMWELYLEKPSTLSVEISWFLRGRTSRRIYITLMCERNFTTSSIYQQAA